MALADFNDLTASIGEWLNRTDLATRAPDFIALAEAQIAGDVRHWRMETRAPITIAGQFTNLPSDWLQTIRLTIGGTRLPLALASVDTMHDKRARDGDTAGEPQLYAHVAGQIEVWPSPSGSFAGELVYYAKPPALQTAGTNWLLTYAPDVYLYGALTASAPFLEHDERTATWASLYAAAVQRLNAEGNMASWSGTGLKMRGRM